MEEHVLQSDLFSSPRIPQNMQRWAESHMSDVAESMDSTWTGMHVDVDSRVNEVLLNTHAPEGLQKWRNASNVLIAVNRLRHLATEQERHFRKHLAKEAAEGLISGTQSDIPPSAEEISYALQLSLFERLFGETTSQLSLPRSQPSSFEWEVIVMLLDSDQTKSTWKTMISDLNATIRNDIGTLLEPKTSREDALEQMKESAEAMSSALQNTLKTIHDSLTATSIKIKALVVQCIENLGKSQQTVEVKKKFVNLFEDSRGLLEELDQTRDNVKRLGELVNLVRAPLAATDVLETCASSISTHVSSHLESKGSDFISLTSLINDYIGSTFDGAPPQTPSSFQEQTSSTDP